MKFASAALAILPLSGVLAHPERMTEEVRRQEAQMIGRSTDKCASAIAKRKEAIMEKRAQSLYRRRVESGNISPNDISKRNTLQYQEIQNTTCALAPDTIWGPYG